MAITTLDGVLAGLQPIRQYTKAATGTLVAGRAFSLWALAGNPGAGGYDTTLNGATISAPTAGIIPRGNPSSGNAYLARLSAGTTQAGMLILADRLWSNGGYDITSTSAQNSTTPTWPARDIDGATAGRGVYLALEVSATTGAGTPTITIAYTNSGGTGSRSATNLFATAASSIASSAYLIGVQGSDEGVQSVQSLTLSATWTSGTINLVAYRPIAMLECSVAAAPRAIDAITSGFPRIYDNSALYVMFVPSTTTATTVTGSYAETHG